MDCNARARGLAVGISDYARHRRCTRKAVYDALRDGVIALDTDGKIDVATADAAWSANRAPEPPQLRGSRGASRDDGDEDTDDGGESRNAADTRRARAQADLAEIKAAEARGELVGAAQVERDAYEAARITRDRVMTVPARVTAIMRAAGSDAEARRLLEDELRSALRSAADEIAAGVSAAGETDAEDP